MFNHGGFTAVKPDVICREILPKISHPAVNADVQAVLFNHFILKPFIGVRIGQVYHTAVKFAEIHQVIAAVPFGGKVALFLPFLVKAAVIYQIGVDIAQEPDAPGVKLLNALWQVRVHFLMVLPVPLKTFSKGCDPFAAPVLAPQAGHLDSFFQGLVKESEGAFIASLYADDQAVVYPFRKFRLAPKECSQLFQQFQEGGGCLNADGCRHLPNLQLMEILVPEIKIRICRGIHMEVIVMAGYKGGFRIVGIVIVASRLVFHIRTPCHIGGLIPSDPRFGGPQREMPSSQIKVRHLLTASVAALLFVRIHPEPEPVDTRIHLVKGEDRALALNPDRKGKLPFHVHGNALRPFCDPGHT